MSCLPSLPGSGSVFGFEVVVEKLETAKPDLETEVATLTCDLGTLVEESGGVAI